MITDTKNSKADGRCVIQPTLRLGITNARAKPSNAGMAALAVIRGCAGKYPFLSLLHPMWALCEHLKMSRRHLLSQVITQSITDFEMIKPIVHGKGVSRSTSVRENATFTNIHYDPH